jgi:DNA-binding MarR family transcriptional regulator
MTLYPRRKKSSAIQRKVPLTVGRPSLLRNGSDRAFRQFVHRLLAFTARLQGVRNGLAELIGLSGMQYTILISIAHLEQESDVNISTLSEHLHISGAFATIETGQLVRKGLVKKRVSNLDRRRVCLSVTQDGRMLLTELAGTQSRANDLIFASLKKQDLERILELLGHLIEGGDAAAAFLDLAAAQRKSAKHAAA